MVYLLNIPPKAPEYSNNTIQYKGDGIFYGKVMGIRSLISYESENIKELFADFYGAMDEYLETCAAEGKALEVAFKGSFNVWFSPGLYKQTFIYAASRCLRTNILMKLW